MNPSRGCSHTLDIKKKERTGEFCVCMAVGDKRCLSTVVGDELPTLTQPVSAGTEDERRRMTESPLQRSVQTLMRLGCWSEFSLGSSKQSWRLSGTSWSVTIKPPAAKVCHLTLVKHLIVIFFFIIKNGYWSENLLCSHEQFLLMLLSRWIFSDSDHK